MITTPSPAALKALNALSCQTAWGEVSKLLESELASVFSVLSEAKDDVTLRQMQGRAQFIQELLRLVRNAPTLLSKLGVSTL